VSSEGRGGDGERERWGDEERGRWREGVDLVFAQCICEEKN